MRRLIASSRIMLWSGSQFRPAILSDTVRCGRLGASVVMTSLEALRKLKKTWSKLPKMRSQAPSRAAAVTGKDLGGRLSN